MTKNEYELFYGSHNLLFLNFDISWHMQCIEHYVVCFLNLSIQDIDLFFYIIKYIFIHIVL